MIRRAVVADAAAVAHVHRAARAEAYADLGPQRVITDEKWAGYLEAGETATFVWDTGGVVVGFVTVEGELLHALYVLPGAQGARIGAALLDVAEGHGARELWVYEANAGARRFYERQGWTPLPETLRTEPGWEPAAPALRYVRG